MYQTCIGRKYFTIQIYFIVWISLLGAFPYVFNRILPIPRLSLLCPIIFCYLTFICCIDRVRVSKLNQNFNLIFGIQFFTWLIYIIIHRDIFYSERIIYMCVIYFLLLCLNSCKGGLYSFFEKYDRFILYMAIGASACFVLVLFFRFKPLFTFTNVDGREAVCYGLTCTNTVYDNFIRCAGYFDEPGAFACWGIWTLIFNNLFFYNKKLENTLLICLLFTMSMAYYIQATLYIILFKLKNTKHIILTLSSILVLITGLYYVSEKNSLLYSLTFKRFEINADGSLKGDNRSNLMEKAKVEFEKSPILGNGISYMSTLDYMADNPFETLAYDGVIGVLVTYLPFIWLWIVSDRKTKFAIIILFVGFLQRPFHHNLIFYFMSYSLFLMSIKKRPEQKMLY